jgi:hypothetical protein
MPVWLLIAVSAMMVMALILVRFGPLGFPAPCTRYIPFIPGLDALLVVAYIIRAADQAIYSGKQPAVVLEGYR